MPLLETQTIPLMDVGSTAVFDVSDCASGSVEVRLANEFAWGGGVVEIERSLSGSLWRALEPDPLTFTDEGIAWRLDLRGVAKLRARVTTGATLHPQVSITVYGDPY